MDTMTRNPVGRVKGYGSAREGLGHWKNERISAIALIPLSLWFLYGAVGLSGASYEEVRAWMAGPINTTFMLLFVVLTFWHTKLGVQVIIEDYVHHEAYKVASLLANAFILTALGAACVVAVLKVSLGS